MQSAQIINVEANSAKYAEGWCVLQTSIDSPYFIAVALLSKCVDKYKGILSCYDNTKTEEQVKSLEELVNKHNLRGEKQIAIIFYRSSFVTNGQIDKIKKSLQRLFTKSVNIQKIEYSLEHKCKTLSINLEAPNIRISYEFQ